MDFILFILSSVFISFSGVVSPGPLTFLTITSSYRNKNAGILVSLGHGVVEFPLIFLISFGVMKFFNSEIIKIIISFLGGVFLIFLGIGYIIDKTKISFEKLNKLNPSLIISGSLATLSNPYFFIWWTTVGSVFVLKAVYFGKLAIFIFAVLHWLCDFFWYTFLSKIVFITKRVISERILNIILKICGSILVIFGLEFIRYSIKMIII